jgi:ATP-grasp domain, R2K clade family 3
MLYIIQENVFKEPNYDKIFETMKKLKLPYEVVKIDTNGELTKTISKRKDVFVFGSIRAARLATNENWIPGSFFGKNHDFQIYKNHYKENLLNYNSEILDIDDNINFLPNEMKFIRPSKDSKVFQGGIYTKNKWLDITERVRERYLGVMPPITIQVNKPHKIYKEARIWIVDGKIVTSSYYKFNENVVWSENVEPEGLEFAQKMVDNYQVAPAFVMDICLTPDGWKIVEINCINCSGFYQGDLQKIVIALEDLYNPKINERGGVWNGNCYIYST